jgi:hypothetical protein
MEGSEKRTSRTRFLRHLVTTFAAGAGVLALTSHASAQVLNCCPDSRCGPCGTNLQPKFCDCSGIGESYCACMNCGQNCCNGPC